MLTELTKITRNVILVTAFTEKTIFPSLHFWTDFFVNFLWSTFFVKTLFSTNHLQLICFILPALLHRIVTLFPQIFSPLLTLLVHLFVNLFNFYRIFFFLTFLLFTLSLLNSIFVFIYGIFLTHLLFAFRLLLRMVFLDLWWTEIEFRTMVFLLMLGMHWLLLMRRGIWAGLQVFFRFVHWQLE